MKRKKLITYDYLSCGQWYKGSEEIEDNSEVIEARIKELESITTEFSGRHKYRNINII